jgi:hypothetical protein
VSEIKDLEVNLSTFNHICGAIRRVLNKRIRKGTQMKFYKTVAAPALTYSLAKQRQITETA